MTSAWGHVRYIHWYTIVPSKWILVKQIITYVVADDVHYKMNYRYIVCEYETFSVGMER